MPYRDFLLPNGVIVRTRVDDEAVREWYDIWEAHPDATQDRPPDLDSETHRMWVGDEMIDHFERLKNAIGDAEWSQPLVTYSATSLDAKRAVKLLISEQNTGLYFRIKGERGDGSIFVDGSRSFSYDELDEANDFMEQTLQAIVSIDTMMGGRTEWLIGLPTEFRQSMEDSEIAMEEYKEELRINGPLPLANRPRIPVPEAESVKRH